MTDLRPLIHRRGLAVRYRSSYIHGMKYAFLIAFVAAAFSASPSAIAQQEPQPPRPETAYVYDCTKLPYVSAGCPSYNEMIVKGDKDLFGLINGSHVFACFKPDEDVFFIASLIEPYPGEYTARSPASANNLQSTGIFSYARFKNGVQEDANTVTGLWRKTKLLNDATFSASAKDDQNSAHAGANDSEISYDTSFRSLNNTRTVYALQIRRSTLRFSETYTTSDVSPENKPGKLPAQPQMKAQAESGASGYCAEFNDRLRQVAPNP